MRQPVTAGHTLLKAPDLSGRYYDRCCLHRPPFTRPKASGKPMASHARSPDHTRQCRPCAACCNHLAIPAGEVGPGSKPAGVACPQLADCGCRIYGRRPRLCANFRCAWLADRSWPEEWRADRCGLMCLREEIEAGLPAAAVYELRPGALGGPSAEEIIEELKRTTAVIAIIDSRQQRRRELGHLGVHLGEPPVRRPHFLGPRPRNPSAARRDTGPPGD